MFRVNPARLLALLACALGCGHETINLLPPSDEAAEGGTSASGGLGTGGRSGGAGGVGGRSGGQSGGRAGRDAGPLPEPDCPASQPNCQPCASPYDCPFGTACDFFRNYCAPFCGTGFDGTQVQCFAPLVCDKDRDVCAECTIDTHCGSQRCERGKCVPRPPPECFNNSQCEDPDKPFCFNNTCQPCSSNFHCDQGEHCTMAGRCEPEGP